MHSSITLDTRRPGAPWAYIRRFWIVEDMWWSALSAADQQRLFPHINLMRWAFNMSYWFASAPKKLSGSPPFLYTCLINLFGPFLITWDISCRFCLLRGNTRSNMFGPVIYFVVSPANASESAMRQNSTTFPLHRTAFFVSRKKFEMSFLPELIRSDRKEASLIDSSLWSIQWPLEVYITLDIARESLLSVLDPHKSLVKEDGDEGSSRFESFWSRFGRLRFSAVVLWQDLSIWQMMVSANNDDTSIGMDSSHEQHVLLENNS
jgi:hypothetical protein